MRGLCEDVGEGVGRVCERMWERGWGRFVGGCGRGAVKERTGGQYQSHNLPGVTAA